MIKAAKAGESGCVVAWSYPPDTFGLAEQAKIDGLNVKAYYSAVGTDFEGFSLKFGPAAENVLGAGGVKDLPETRANDKKHKEITGVEPITGAIRLITKCCRH